MPIYTKIALFQTQLYLLRFKLDILFLFLKVQLFRTTIIVIRPPMYGRVWPKKMFSNFCYLIRVEHAKCSEIRSKIEKNETISSKMNRP